MGSIWHIVRDENVYKIMSDHKGFSTIMSITHRADSPTRSLTPTEEVVKKVIAGKKLKIKPKNQPAKNLAQEEPEDVVDLNHQEDSTTRSLIPTEDEEKEVIAAPKTNVQKIKPKIKPKNQPANDLAQEEPEDVVYLNHQEDSTTRSLTPTEEVVKK
ncbi:MAG UNVERIFIED_CONTAM: hypothetical protein LVQ98_02605 [Rickettsiaceae bacterium]|jgi:hypothetical protein